MGLSGFIHRACRNSALIAWTLATALTLAVVSPAQSQTQTAPQYRLQNRPDPQQQPQGDHADDNATDSRFNAVDSYADATPSSSTITLARLAYHLGAAGTDDEIKARALFRWLTRHIAYDAAAAISGRNGDQRPGTVLERRTATAEGFANLAQALGTIMGLQMQTVQGWSRGARNSGTLKNAQARRPDHVWNAVRINGQWHLMDAAWGAGYIGDDFRFVRQFQPHYFLTDPAVFIIDHFPENLRWQLLAQPLSATDQANLPLTRPAFWQLGLKVGRPQRMSIEAAQRTQITLKLTQPLHMSAQLLTTDTAQALPGRHTLIQQNPREARIDIAFPAKGDFILRIFARAADMDGPMDWVMDYHVRATEGADDASFPSLRKAFVQRGALLLQPLNGRLHSGEQYSFRLKVPGAHAVAVLAGDAWQELQPDGDDWTGDIMALAGEHSVMARFSAEGPFISLLKYAGPDETPGTGGISGSQ